VLEISATAGNDVIFVTTGGDGISLLVRFQNASEGSIRSLQIETLHLRTLGGGDKVTVERVDELNLQNVKIDVGSGASDTVTLWHQ
jgi:hypothetical protein